VLCAFRRWAKDISSPFVHYSYSTKVSLALHTTFLLSLWRTEYVQLLAIACWQLFPIGNNCTRWHSIFKKAPQDRGWSKVCLKIAALSLQMKAFDLHHLQSVWSRWTVSLSAGKWLTCTFHSSRSSSSSSTLAGSRYGNHKKCKLHFCFISLAAFLFQNTGPFFLLTCSSNLVKLWFFNALYALCFHYRCLTSFLIISFLL